MKLIKKVGDFSIERELPSCRLHKDDIIRLINRVDNHIRVHENYAETSKGEEQTDKLDIKFRSSGTKDGIDWSVREHNVDSFFAEEILGTTLTNLEMEFDYHISVITKDEKVKWRYSLDDKLLRHITFTFSQSICKIRITGDSKEWIEETYSIVKDFIERLRTPNDDKRWRSLVSILFFAWFSAFLLVILIGLFVQPDLSISISMAMPVSIFFLMFFGLGTDDNLTNYLEKTFPKVELILIDSPDKKSMIKEYVINFILGIISSILASIIVVKLLLI